MSFISLINSISSGVQSAAPVIQSLSDLSNLFLNNTTSNPAAGNYPGISAGGSTSEGTWYKNPLIWVGVALAVLLLFGKKLKRLF